MDPGDAAPERRPASGRSHPRALVLFAAVVAIAVVASGLFLLSLPPPLTIHDGSTLVRFFANFPSTDSTRNVAYGNFTATSYANQTAGPSSSLTLDLTSYAFGVGFNGLIQGVQLFFNVSVRGRFASDVHPDTVQLTGNLTGTGIMINAYNDFVQGPNVSANPQQTIGLSDHGAGMMTATLANAAGPGPVYVFRYNANGGISLDGYRSTEFFGLRAVVTGWMLPPISVGIVVELKNVPGRLVVVPAGTTWTFQGYNATAFGSLSAASYALTGSLNSTAPVDAYLVDQMDGFGAPGWPPPSWRWKAQLGPAPVSFNATLPPAEWVYLVFYTLPMGVANVTATVTATQAIIALT